MKKQILKVVALMLEINENTPHRVSIDTFASCDNVDVRLYVGGYSDDAKPVTLSYPSMSMMAIHAYLMDIKIGREAA